MGEVTKDRRVHDKGSFPNQFQTRIIHSSIGIMIHGTRLLQESLNIIHDLMTSPAPQGRTRMSSDAQPYEERWSTFPSTERCHTTLNLEICHHPSLRETPHIRPPPPKYRMPDRLPTVAYHDPLLEFVQDSDTQFSE